MAGLWDALVGATQGVAGQVEAQQQQQRKLQQIVMEQQAKAAFDPTEQAKAQALQLINLLKASPVPEGGFSRNELEQPQLADAYSPVQQMTEFQNQPLLSKLDQLKAVFAPAQSGITQVYSLNPQTNAMESHGSIPRTGRIVPTTLTPQQREENAAAQARGTARGKSEIDVSKSVGKFENGLQVIQSQLDEVNRTTADYVKKNPPFFTTEAHIRHRLGTYDPTFRRADSAIKAQLGNFLKTVEGIPGFRLAAAEFKSLGQILTDLPYLPPSDQQKNLQVIHQLLGTIRGKIGTETPGLSDDEEGLVSSLLEQ